MIFIKKIGIEILVTILYYSGIPSLFRELIQKNRVTILFFHDPKVSIASRNFRWLSDRYNIISLDHYLAARKKGDMRTLPPKSMIITFDDGHIGNYELLRLVKEYNIPITIFLCSGIVNTNRHYWFKYSELDSSDSLKILSNQKRLNILSESGFYPEKEFGYPQALSKDQILEMQEYVNFQAHTVFHPCLPRCNDEEARFEIEQSKKQLEQDIGLAINALAYPNGDYCARDIQFLQNAGYSCGLNGGHGFNNEKTDLYSLNRLPIGDGDNIKLLAIKASGIWAFLKFFFRTPKTRSTTQMSKKTGTPLYSETGYI